MTWVFSQVICEVVVGVSLSPDKGLHPRVCPPGRELSIPKKREQRWAPPHTHTFFWAWSVQFYCLLETQVHSTYCLKVILRGILFFIKSCLAKVRKQIKKEVEQDTSILRLQDKKNNNKKEKEKKDYKKFFIFTWCFFELCCFIKTSKGTRTDPQQPS